MKKDKESECSAVDPDGRVILARRKMFLALALSGATGLGTCACTKSMSVTDDTNTVADGGNVATDSGNAAEGSDSFAASDSAAAWDTGTEIAMGTDTNFPDTVATDTDTLDTDSETVIYCGGCGGCGCACGSA